MVYPVSLSMGATFSYEVNVPQEGGKRGRSRMGSQHWDRSFPLENTKSPHPENPGKLLKNYNLAHPGAVLKIAEKLLKITILPRNYLTITLLVIFSNFSVIFRTVPGWAKL